MKQFIDIFFSFLFLILLFPFFLIIAFLIKLDSPGDVFFVRRKMGKNFKPFNLYKFRTMLQGTTRKGIPQNFPNDLRISRVGKFLLKFKIDTLPQLWNVLKGEMSIVGPWPETEKCINQHREDYAEILKIRPGMINISSSFYKQAEDSLRTSNDPEKHYINVHMPEIIKLSKEYVKNASLIFDIKLMLRKVFSLIFSNFFVNTTINSLTSFRGPIIIIVHLFIFILSNYLAFSIRFDGNVPAFRFSQFLMYLPLIVGIRVVFLYSFSLDKGLWRYVSAHCLISIILATSAGSFSFVLFGRYLLGDITYPRSIYIIDWILNIIFMYGVRLLRQFYDSLNYKPSTKRKVILIGAGKAAYMFLQDMEISDSYAYEIIGLVDDNPKKKGLRINNIPILGMRKDLKSIIERNAPEEFIIAIPALSPPKLENIVTDLRQYGLPIKTLPGLWSLLSGKSRLREIHPIASEDVLFRAPVSGNGIELKDFIQGKRVMITGAGGSIGSELARQMGPLNPGKLILFERHEENLFKINNEICSLFNQKDEEEMADKKGKTLQHNNGSNPQLYPIIGDILDERRVCDVIEKFCPHIIFHAAAYKHVPLMESHPYEAFKTNVIGTKIIAESAKKLGVERFIMISTDKAVNPVNVMGQTKKIAEELIQYFSKVVKSRTGNGKNSPTPTKFITVRFGNVLGSSGSVLPLFKEQIESGGPVKITHPEMTRYFMTIPEAVSLVIESAAIGNGGEIFVLDMGKPVKILDLARRIIGFYGYKPGIDMDISFVGLRPGEKLHEELFNADEIIEKSGHPKINRVKPKVKINHDLLYLLNKDVCNDAAVLNLLKNGNKKKDQVSS